MTENPLPTPTRGPIPTMQRILDNPFLLLFIGITIPSIAEFPAEGDRVHSTTGAGPGDED